MFNKKYKELAWTIAYKLTEIDVLLKEMSIMHNIKDIENKNKYITDIKKMLEYQLELLNMIFIRNFNNRYYILKAKISKNNTHFNVFKTLIDPKDIDEKPKNKRDLAFNKVILAINSIS